MVTRLSFRVPILLLRLSRHDQQFATVKEIRFNLPNMSADLWTKLYNIHPAADTLHGGALAIAVSHAAFLTEDQMSRPRTVYVVIVCSSTHHYYSAGMLSSFFQAGVIAEDCSLNSINKRSPHHFTKTSSFTHIGGLIRPSFAHCMLQCLELPSQSDSDMASCKLLCGSSKTEGPLSIQTLEQSFFGSH